MSFAAASTFAPAGISLWLLVGSGALVAATVLVYWFVSARDTLDRLDSVLPPREADRHADDDSSVKDDHEDRSA